MVNLFTTFYKENDEARAQELIECLKQNINCKIIDRIYIWLENLDTLPVLSEKISIIRASTRPKYNDFFNEINKITKVDDINIIANTDIYFKEDLEIIKQVNLNNKCYALTRWDIKENQEEEFAGRVDS